VIGNRFCFMLVELARCFSPGVVGILVIQNCPCFSPLLGTNSNYTAKPIKIKKRPMKFPSLACIFSILYE
ncbi:MAG: hypothetical protein ACI82S_003126, partial [Patiriisocius sp.]